VEVRKFFKLLEYTFKGKQFPMEKLRRNETANIMLNSKDFEDPQKMASKEEIRLKDSKVHPGPSNLFY